MQSVVDLPGVSSCIFPRAHQSLDNTATPRGYFSRAHISWMLGKVLGLEFVGTDKQDIRGIKGAGHNLSILSRD
jgi:hypothetical protein